MKKIFIITAFLFGFIAANSQSYTYIAQRYEWLAGVFKALGVPSGAGPAAFQTGQRQWAGAIYYDSIGIDSGLYVWSGLAWREVGITYTASEGLSKVGNDFQFGGIATTDRVVTFNNNSNTITILATGSGGLLNVNTIDTVNIPDVPKINGMGGTSVIRFPTYAATTYRGGAGFTIEYQNRDSMKANSFGADFGWALNGRVNLTKMAGHSGRSVYMGGTSYAEAIPANIGVVSLIGPSTVSNYKYAKGWWSALTGYLLIEARDTIDAFIGHLSTGAVNPNSRVHYYYDFFAGPMGQYHSGARIGKHWGFYNVSPLSQNYFGGNVLIGDSNTVASALLNVTSTTKGALLPRMTSTQRTTISSPATGLIVFDTDSTSYFQYTGSAWQNLYNISSGGSGTVNAGAVNTLAYYPGAGTTVDDLTALTINSALASDANGLPVASATTATELGFVSGVTSSIQTQVDGKQNLLVNSAGLAAALNDETGTGLSVFNTNPTFNTKVILTGATETTSNPVLDATQTWNNAATTFTGLKFNVTNTTSATGSLLADLQVGGTSQFSVRKDGSCLALLGHYLGSTHGTGGTGMELFTGSRLVFRRAGTIVFQHDGTDLQTGVSSGIGWGAMSGSSPDTKLNRDGTTGIIAQKNSTTAQEFRIYNTDATDDEFISIGAKNVANTYQIASEATGSGVVRDIEILSGSANTRITKLAGSGTRFVTSDASGNLATKTQTSLTKDIVVEIPTAAENIFLFRTPVAITVSSVNAVLVGSASPSVTYNIAFGTDRTSGTNVYTAGQTVTSTTTGTAASGVNDATIPANSWIWVTTAATGGVVTQLNISLLYTED